MPTELWVVEYMMRAAKFHAVRFSRDAAEDLRVGLLLKRCHSIEIWACRTVRS